jgi:amino acid transporter
VIANHRSHGPNRTRPTNGERSDAPGAQGRAEDRHLKRNLGFWHLTAIAFGGTIGSGWLFGSMYAAQAAGPEAIITWVIGGLALLLIALVLVEVGASRPESGGLVRWPLYSNGRLVATLIGWGVWVAYATNPPSESAAVLQYASRWIHGLYNGTRLTGPGVLAAVGLMAIFVALNWFGVQLFARVNAAVTAAKFVVPALTVVALIASGFDSGHVTGSTSPGGFAPYGWAAGLSAIATAGIIYAYTGFQGPIDLSGEARNPGRDVPRAVITALVAAMVLYIALQVAFLGAVPNHDLLHGWKGVNFSSPFSQLATLLNLSWLSWLLYVDAVISPGGSALVFTAETGRESYALGKNRFFPQSVAVVDRGSGVPRRALVVNFVIGLAFLLPFRSWHSIVAATSELGLFAYSISAISAEAFRRAAPEHVAGWIKGMRVLAPASFVVASLILYWAGWKELRIALPVLLVAVAVYLYQQARERIGREDVRAGAWLVVYLVAILLVSALGSFDGTDTIPAPWDSVAVAVIGLAAFVAGVRAAERYVEANGVPDPGDPHDLDLTGV